jgi:UDP:flavonoid glycosyltransferase YjiC (YdhE family)
VRVLFSSTSGYGHVLPMLPLARSFAAAGHQVLWAANDQACQVLSAAGVDTSPAGMTGVALRTALRPLTATVASLRPQDRAGYMFPAKFAALLPPAMVRDLLPLAGSWAPDLIIHEQAELAAPLVGAILGVRTITHSFAGAVPPTTLTEAGKRLAGLWIEHGLDPREYAGCFSGPRASA